jgi:hypothetical protein
MPLVRFTTTRTAEIDEIWDLQVTAEDLADVSLSDFVRDNLADAVLINNRVADSGQGEVEAGTIEFLP